jgi:hypothetical protein
MRAPPCWPRKVVAHLGLSPLLPIVGPVVFSHAKARSREGFSRSEPPTFSHSLSRPCPLAPRPFFPPLPLHENGVIRYRFFGPSRRFARAVPPQFLGEQICVDAIRRIYESVPDATPIPLELRRRRVEVIILPLDEGEPATTGPDSAGPDNGMAQFFGSLPDMPDPTLEISLEPLPPNCFRPPEWCGGSPGR